MSSKPWNVTVYTEPHHSICNPNPFCDLNISVTLSTWRQEDFEKEDLVTLVPGLTQSKTCLISEDFHRVEPRKMGCWRTMLLSPYISYMDNQSTGLGPETLAGPCSSV